MSPCLEVHGAENGTFFSLDALATRTGEKQPPVRLVYVLEGTPWKGDPDLPLPVATLIPAGSLSSKKADFIVADSHHVFESNKNDPNRIA